MRPYSIEITWIDYNATLEDDVYIVEVWNSTKTTLITSWEACGNTLGQTITKYMGRGKNVE